MSASLVAGADDDVDSVFDQSEFPRRLVKRHQPGLWIGALRRAFGPVAELAEDGTRPGELIARIVILGEPKLRPYQQRALQAFIRAERRATLAAISVHDSPGDDTFEKFANTSPDSL